MDDTYTDDYGSTADLLWLDDIACVDWDPDRFFVEAGHALDPETRALCRGCPVRKHCVEWSYLRNHSSGYTGGLSPSQRRSMTLEEALALVDRETAAKA